MAKPGDKKQFRFKHDNNIFYFWERLNAWFVITPDGRESSVANQATLHEAYALGELEEVK